MVLAPSLLLDQVISVRLDLRCLCHWIDQRMFVVIDEVLLQLESLDVGIRQLWHDVFLNLVYFLHLYSFELRRKRTTSASRLRYSSWVQLLLRRICHFLFKNDFLSLRIREHPLSKFRKFIKKSGSLLARFRISAKNCLKLYLPCQAWTSRGGWSPPSERSPLFFRDFQTPHSQNFKKSQLCSSREPFSSAFFRSQQLSWRWSLPSEFFWRAR